MSKEERLKQLQMVIDLLTEKIKRYKGDVPMRRHLEEVIELLEDERTGLENELDNEVRANVA